MAAGGITRRVQVPQGRRLVPGSGFAKTPCGGFWGHTLPCSAQQGVGAVGCLGTWYLLPLPQVTPECHIQPCATVACPRDHRESPIPITSRRGGGSIPAPADAKTRQGNLHSRCVPVTPPGPGRLSGGSSSLCGCSCPLDAADFFCPRF